MVSHPSINAETRYCAVLGHPVRHSASPAMQNAGIKSLELNWRYLAFDVLPDRLPLVLSTGGALGFVGFNLTVPHKVIAFDLVDVVDPSAKSWGAVNTILFEGKDNQGQWRPMHEIEIPTMETRSVGYNTDADAIIQSIKEDLAMDLKGASVLVCGTGGAGRVAVLNIAAQRPNHLFLVNRTLSKAETLATEISTQFPGIQVHLGYPDRPEFKLDLILNATSLGLKTDDPIPLDGKCLDFRQARCVYDMIYRPSKTPLLEKAEEAGCKIANGLGMLLYQGAKSLEIWTGKTAPVQVMKNALVQHIYHGTS